jgi:ATP/ADP translocase
VVASTSAPPIITTRESDSKDVVGILGGLLPVASSELPKFLSMSALMFFIVYVFTMTRDTKDTLIVTNCGAEAIAFLKVMVLHNMASAR